MPVSTQARRTTRLALFVMQLSRRSSAARERRSSPASALTRVSAPGRSASRCDHERATKPVTQTVHHDAYAGTVLAWSDSTSIPAHFVLATCDRSDTAQMSVCRHAMF